jgi:small-conductance mechanosensitive channel
MSSRKSIVVSAVFAVAFAAMAIPPGASPGPGIRYATDAYPGFDNKNAPAKFSFTSFSSSSLDIGVIVWFNTRDFMDAQRMKQEINLLILERFNAAGLSFAYPSVTNYLVTNK